MPTIIANFNSSQDKNKAIYSSELKEYLESAEAVLGKDHNPNKALVIKLKNINDTKQVITILNTFNAKTRTLNTTIEPYSIPSTELRNKYNKINEQLENYRKETRDRHHEERMLQSERDLFAAKIIIEEKLLNRIRWTFNSFSWTDKLVLRGITTKNDSVKPIFEIWKCDYHDSIQLDTGTELRIDDNDISLLFDNAENSKKFLKENNIKVDISELDKKVEEAKKEYGELSSFYNNCKEKFNISE